MADIDFAAGSVGNRNDFARESVVVAEPRVKSGADHIVLSDEEWLRTGCNLDRKRCYRELFVALVSADNAYLAGDCNDRADRMAFAALCTAARLERDFHNRCGDCSVAAAKVARDGSPFQSFSRWNLAY